MFYPTWFPGCSNLAVDVSGSIIHDSRTGPETKEYDLAGNMLGSLSGTKLWAGFPSVNPRAPRLLALAAQHFNASSGNYDENFNYVYIANTAGKPPRVTPLDQRAPVNRYVARFEGRTPTWSPDGRWIAFESNRNCALPQADPYFAIFIQDAEGQMPARQVTDCGYNAQHAKWYRQPVNGRTLLITTVRLSPAYTGNDNLTLYARGIAALDVTAFVRR